MARARDLQTLIDTVEPVTGEMLPVPGSVARRAFAVVAAYAHDADDCRLLLRALGLMPEDEEAGGAAVVASGPEGVAPSGPASGAGSATTAAGAPASPRPEDAAPVRDRRRRP